MKYYNVVEIGIGGKNTVHAFRCQYGDCLSVLKGLHARGLTGIILDDCKAFRIQDYVVSPKCIVDNKSVLSTKFANLVPKIKTRKTVKVYKVKL